MNPVQAPDVREGEVAVSFPERIDAGLVFIGRVRTPFRERGECPRQGAVDGPACSLEIDADWRPALTGLAVGARVQVMYWMHHARRDLLLQNPDHRGELRGSFAIRSPVRPNPIASSITVIREIDIVAGVVTVGGLDCLDGTPLLDLKPEHCVHR